MLFRASAPGSLMLLGEYAVLSGKPALVCAVDKRINVELKPRSDKKITISSALGELTTEISQLNIKAPFQFVLATLKKHQNQLIVGCDIKITAEFSDQIGFASSAAVTVSLLIALHTWLKLPFTKISLAKKARQIIRQVQGMGSGADTAACVFGGMLIYRMQPFSVEELSFHYPLTVVYSGVKTPTTIAVAHVKKSFDNKKMLFQNLSQAIEKCVCEGRKAILEKNWPELGNIMNIQQGLMDALGVNTASLTRIVDDLRQSKTILGAKISGSGLGDCVVGLGHVEKEIDNFLQIPIAIAHQGVVCETQ